MIIATLSTFQTHTQSLTGSFDLAPDQTGTVKYQHVTKSCWNDS
jgi:hypothetical protein